MFNRLKNKWKASTPQLILILCTFALGGSTCGYLGKKVMNLLSIDHPALYLPFYILIITILWPFCVLIISIPLGQYPFFRNYLTKVFRRLGFKKG